MSLEVKKMDSLTESQIELLKNTICKGVTNEEFEIFLHACRRTGLDPFMKQIYAVKRGGKAGPSMTIQTGIDGYRLIAERSGKYAPGKETTYQYDSNGKLLSATAFIKKMTGDGTWHDVSATAFYDEYAQPSPFWQRMRHIMLAKCAESLALRRAFPAELSGIYTEDEMRQADQEVIIDREAAVIEPSAEEFETKITIIKKNFRDDEVDTVEKCIEFYKDNYMKMKPKEWSRVFCQFLDKAISNQEKFHDLVMEWNAKKGEK